MEYINILIPSIVSVASIYISNYLGRKSYLNKIELENKKNLYSNFYFPIISRLLNYSYKDLDYFHLIAYERLIAINITKDLTNQLPKELFNSIENLSKNHDDWLLDALYKNLIHIPTSIAIKLNDYNLATSNSLLFLALNKDGCYNEEYRKFHYKASSLFDKIIILILKEAQKLSEELKYPNTPESVLNIFLAGMERTDPRYRALPETMHQHYKLSVQKIDLHEH